MFGIETIAAAIDAHAKQTKVSLAAINFNLQLILMTLNAKGDQIVTSLADLKAAVEANGVVVQSAIVLIEGIAAALKAAIEANDPAKVQEVLDQLNAEKQALADAVAANTTPTP